MNSPQAFLYRYEGTHGWVVDLALILMDKVTIVLVKRLGIDRVPLHYQTVTLCQPLS